MRELKNDFKQDFEENVIRFGFKRLGQVSFCLEEEREEGKGYVI